MKITSTNTTMYIILTSKQSNNRITHILLRPNVIRNYSSNWWCKLTDDIKYRVIQYEVHVSFLVGWFIEIEIWSGFFLGGGFHGILTVKTFPEDQHENRLFSDITQMIPLLFVTDKFNKLNTDNPLLHRNMLKIYQNTEN